MRSRKEIEKRLGRPLDEQYVDQQDGFDYVPSWYVIWKANEIFGVDGWSSETTRNEIVNTGTNRKDNQFAEAISTVRVEVKFKVPNTNPSSDFPTTSSVNRTGTGQGSGWGREARGDAAKTAESDAQKRAFRTFGNQFGLPLYIGDGSLEMDWDEQDWFGPKQKGILRQHVSELNLPVSEAAACFSRASEEQMTVEEAMELFKEHSSEEE